jgi:hypothetical protein
LAAVAVLTVGLLQLLRRDPDLLAMVMGHEIAHALARHNTEKMGMGLALSMISSMAMVRTHVDSSISCCLVFSCVATGHCLMTYGLMTFHNTEKMGMGLALSMISSMAMVSIWDVICICGINITSCTWLLLVGQDGCVFPFCMFCSIEYANLFYQPYACGQVAQSHRTAAGSPQHREDGHGAGPQHDQQHGNGEVYINVPISWWRVAFLELLVVWAAGFQLFLRQLLLLISKVCIVQLAL